MSSTVNNIIQLAKKWGYWDGNNAEFNDVGLEQFVDLVAAIEREACAQVCEGHYDTAKAAREIRERGEK